VTTGTSKFLLKSGNVREEGPQRKFAYMLILSCLKHEVLGNAGQRYDIKIANRCFENVAKFRYLGTTITNQNLIQEEI
jgi:hypothetical protein